MEKKWANSKEKRKGKGKEKGKKGDYSKWLRVNLQAQSLTSTAAAGPQRDAAVAGEQHSSCGLHRHQSPPPRALRPGPLREDAAQLEAEGPGLLFTHCLILDLEHLSQRHLIIRTHLTRARVI